MSARIHHQLAAPALRASTISPALGPWATEKSDPLNAEAAPKRAVLPK